MLLGDETIEGAKCEELEKIVVDNDSEKFFFFSGQSSVASLGEGRADRVS